MPFTSETAKLLRGPGGRKKVNSVEKLASEIAREFIERNAKPILETYVALAAGQVVERRTRSGKKKFKLLVDPPTTRHVIDKLLPEIKPDANTRPIAIQIVHESPENVRVESEGNGVKIHLGSE